MKYNTALNIIFYYFSSFYAINQTIFFIYSILHWEQLYQL